MDDLFDNLVPLERAIQDHINAWAVRNFATISLLAESEQFDLKTIKSSLKTLTEQAPNELALSGYTFLLATEMSLNEETNTP